MGLNLTRGFVRTNLEDLGLNLTRGFVRVDLEKLWSAELTITDCLHVLFLNLTWGFEMPDVAWLESLCVPDLATFVLGMTVCTAVIGCWNEKSCLFLFNLEFCLIVFVLDLSLPYFCLTSCWPGCDSLILVLLSAITRPYWLAVTACDGSWFQLSCVPQCVVPFYCVYRS